MQAGDETDAQRSLIRDIYVIVNFVAAARAASRHFVPQGSMGDGRLAAEESEFVLWR